MEELSRDIELLIISNVIQLDGWRRIDCKYDKINNIGVRNAIKNKYEHTNIKKWKKEYATYLHKEARLTVEIHRCVNSNNHREEFDVKIKKPRKKDWVDQIIAVIEEELGTVLMEVAATEEEE